jgi:hypothetical protein
MHHPDLDPRLLQRRGQPRQQRKRANTSSPRCAVHLSACTCVPCVHSPVQPCAFSIASMLPASLHHPCPPCARLWARQPAAAGICESSDHLGFACSFFAGATAATAAYVSTMPTRTATPLQHRHALSAPIFTMHTARAALRGHTWHIPGL